MKKHINVPPIAAGPEGEPVQRGLAASGCYATALSFIPWVRSKFFRAVRWWFGYLQPEQYEWYPWAWDLNSFDQSVWDLKDPWFDHDNDRFPGWMKVAYFLCFGLVTLVLLLLLLEQP